MRKNYAAAGVPMIILAATAIVVLDIRTAFEAPQQLRRTISEYGLGPQQWVFTVAVVLLAVGSMAVLASLVDSGLTRFGSVGSIALSLWSLGLITVVAAPKQDWSADAVLGVSGAVHRFGSAVAFVCLPIAVLLVAHPHRREHAVARWSFRAGVAAALTLTPIVFALIVGLTSSTPWFRVLVLGYAERVVVVTEVVALLIVGLWASRARKGTVVGELVR